MFGLVDEGERDRSSSAPGLRVVAEVLKSRVSPSGTWTMFETVSAIWKNRRAW